MLWYLVNIVHLFSIFAIGIYAEAAAAGSWIKETQNGAIVLAVWCAVGLGTRTMADREAGDGPSILWLLLLGGFGLFFLYFGVTGELPG